MSEQEQKQEEKEVLAKTNTSNEKQEEEEQEGEQQETKKDQQEKEEQQEEIAVNKKYVYSCQKCRSQLFTTDQLVPHDSTSSGNKPFQKNKFVEHQKSDSACTSVFLDYELVPWLSSNNKSSSSSSSKKAEDSKDLLCPNTTCNAKLGSKQWEGTQCSCGTWVTPSFKILLNRLDTFDMN